jgi:integrase
MSKRTLNRLTDIEVRKAKDPGMYADGGGLYLRIDPRRADKRWVFIFHLGGKRGEMVLGSAGELSLAQARTEREAARKLVKAGQSPIIARKLEREAAIAAQQPAMTFKVWAKQVAPAVAPKAEKARAAWLKMTTEWTGALADKPLPAITTEDVLAALKPYWKSRPETGRRLRMRIEAVLDAAKAKGLIPDPWSNPARWKGHLQHLLEKHTKPPKHHPALPYGETATFIEKLRAKDTMSARALEFTVLTAARTSETIRATWAEMDLAEKVWTVPAERMKGRRVHRVPLSDAALAVLEAVKPPDGHAPTSWVFPSLWRAGKPLSTAAMERALQDLGYDHVTVHGFRSSFRDWAGDATNFARETVEAALAHMSGDAVERAYRRGDALLKRRKLMEAWAAFLARKAGENVTPMARPQT